MHRDIKPANVFLCRYGEDYDFVKVLDFGIVKACTRHRRRAGHHTGTPLQGTPAFIAPEQALGGADVDGTRRHLLDWLRGLLAADRSVRVHGGHGDEGPACARAAGRNHPRREPRLRFHRTWMPWSCVASPKTANAGRSLPAISFSGSTRLHSSNLGPTRASGSGGARTLPG